MLLWFGRNSGPGLLGGVEAVHVLHDKFAAAHDAGFSPLSLRILVWN